jgi:uncharacterized protein YjiS (DUF1127 family)
MKEWFKKVFVALIEARQREANAKIAAMQLYRMSDRELNDIGIGRGDIRRIAYEEVQSYKNKKENVSWWQYLNSKFSGKLYKTNHA